MNINEHMFSYLVSIYRCWFCRWSQSLGAFLEKGFHHFFTQRTGFNGRLKTVLNLKIYNSWPKKRGHFRLLSQLWHNSIGNLYVGVYLHYLLFSVSFADIFFSTLSVNMSHEEKRIGLVHRDTSMNLWTSSMLYFLLFFIWNLSQASVL